MIDDFTYVSNVLDCTGLTESSSIYELLGREDISTTQACSYQKRGSATTPTFQVDDQSTYDAALLFLRDNGILAETYDPAPLLSAYECKLRAGELIKVILYTQKMGSYTYSTASGAYDTGTEALVTLQANIQANGYTDVTPKLVDTGIASGVGVYSSYTPVSLTRDLAFSAIDETNYNRLTQGARFYFEGNVVLHTSGADITLPFTCNQTVSEMPSWLIFPTEVTVRCECSISDSTVSGSGRLILTSSVSGTASVSTPFSMFNCSLNEAIASGVCVRSVDVTLTRVYTIVSTMFGSRVVELPDITVGTGNVPLSTCRYDADVRYGHNPTGLDFTLSGVSVHLASGLDSYLLSTRPSYTSEGTFNTSSNPTDKYNLKITAAPVAITGVSGSITTPSVMRASSDSYCQLTFNADGVASIGVRFAGGLGPSVVSNVTDETDLVALASQAIRTYDAKTAFELLDDLTVSDLREWFKGERVYYDAYTAMLMDHTFMQIAAAEIEAIQAMMLSEPMMLDSPYKLNYFTEEDGVSGTKYPASPSDRVEYAEGSWCNAEDLGSYSDWGYYLDGVVLNADHHVRIDHFVYQGLGLSEYWEARDAANVIDPFIRALASAHTDALAQIMLYEAINGVVNSTDWVTDIGAYIRDIANTAKDVVDQLITSITPIRAFTISETNALIAGASSRSVPATRVASILDAAIAAGANSANALLNYVSILGPNGTTAIADPRSRDIINSIKDISGYSEVIINALEPDRTKSCTTSFFETFTQRFASSIISSGGCDAEVADAGIGTQALYPALFATSIPAADFAATLPKGSILLPFDKSYAVISRSTFNGCVDVAWYARCNGGSDPEIYSMARASAEELIKLFNTVCGGLGYTATLDWPDGVLDISELGTYLYIGLAPTLSIKYGSELLRMLPVIGPQLKSTFDQMTGTIDYTDQITASLNVAFRLGCLSEVKASITDGSETYTDMADVRTMLLESVLAACIHGAFVPFGTDEQLRTNRFGMMCPGNPYFRYIYIGEHEDYAPLVITGFTLLTALSARTVVRAWSNPVRDPTFIPLLLGSSTANVAAASISSAYQSIARSDDPTLAMQTDILNNIKETAAAQGTYTDSEGTVTLRDLLGVYAETADSIDALKNELSSLASDTGQTSLTY